MLCFFLFCFVFFPSGSGRQYNRRRLDFKPNSSDSVFSFLLFVNLPASLQCHRLKMDWQGQKQAEQLMQIMLVAFAVGAFGTGYVMGSFQMMMLIYAGGVVLTTLITVPNWPFFNHHPLNWLDPSEAEKHPKPRVQQQTPSSSKKKYSKK